MGDDGENWGGMHDMDSGVSYEDAIKPIEDNGVGRILFTGPRRFLIFL